MALTDIRAGRPTGRHMSANHLGDRPWPDRQGLYLRDAQAQIPKKSLRRPRPGRRNQQLRPI
jgi:hypothetical protein